MIVARAAIPLIDAHVEVAVATLALLVAERRVRLGIDPSISVREVERLAALREVAFEYIRSSYWIDRIDLRAEVQ